MQISSKEFFRAQINSMSDLQSRIGRLQEEISSGKKILQPSDDPSGYVKIQSLKQSESAFEQYDRNIGVANQRLSQEDSVLSQVVISATRLQELAIAGANGTNDPSARGAIIAEMEQISDQIATLANSVDSNGDFIFAGYQSRTKPFLSEADGSITYVGDSGRREVEIAKGVTTATSSSGREVFMQVSQPGGQRAASIFDIVHSAIKALKMGDESGVSLTGTVTNNSLNTNTNLEDLGFAAGSTFNIALENGIQAEFVVSPGMTIDSLMHSINSNSTLNPGGSGSRVEMSFYNGNIKLVSKANTNFTFTTSASTEALQNLIGVKTAEGKNVVGSGTQSFDAQAHINQARTEAVSNMKAAMEHFSTYQTICGSRLQKVDSVQQIGQSAITSSKTMRSTIEDAKIEEVATELSQKSLNLTASQTTFAKIAQLSLFNFLR